MRLSQAATVPQSVELSVLAAHRMDPSTVPVPGTAPTLRYAGRLDAAEIPTALAPYLGSNTRDSGPFLTSWTDFIAEPGQIDDDYVFTQADSDTTYQQVIHHTRDRGDLTGALLILAVAATAVTATVLLVRGARQAR